MANNKHAYYTLTERRVIKWMRGLGDSLAIALPEDETPLDWAVAQGNQLPLGVWEADDHYETLRVASDVAQIQLTVAIYAVVARYEASLEVEPEMVRNLAEKVRDTATFSASKNPTGLKSRKSTS